MNVSLRLSDQDVEGTLPRALEPQEQEAMSQPHSGSGEGEWALLVLSGLTQSGTPVHGMVPPSEWVFPLHLNLSGNTLNRHTQRPVSMVILNTVS